MAARERIPLRREVLILVPISLALLLALDGFTLLSYRSGVEQLIEERRLEAGRLARQAAAQAAHAASVNETELALRRLGPGMLGAALLQASGEPRLLVGDLPAGPLLAPLAATLPGAVPVVLGPQEPAAPGRIVAFARLPGSEAPTILRLDLAASTLSRQLTSVRVLTWVVMGLSGALLLLVVVFLRHLLRPYAALLDRARELSPVVPGEDEVEHLVKAFERAVLSLRTQPHGGEQDELSALEQTLGPSLDSGLLLLDREGRVIALNAAGAQLLTVPVPPTGTAWQEAFAAVPAWCELLAGALAAQQAVKRREVAVGSSTLGVTVHALRRADGEVRGYLALFADLTASQREERESRFAASLAQLGEMAAGVAHELRNSLGTVTGYLGLLERDPHGPAAAEHMAELRREVTHLKRVVGEFLAFARPGTRRSERVDLAAILRRAAEDPALAPVRLDVAGGGPWWVEGDAELLERAIKNLVANAVDAQRANGRLEQAIEARCVATGHELELQLLDRGDGVPPALRDQLFRPFATARPGGLGLGLAVSHRIVTLHGGRLTLEDRAGGGSVARLVLLAAKSG